MELAVYLRLFRRWLWLILIGVVLGVGIRWLTMRAATPLYQAATTIRIGSSGALANPGSSLITTEFQLAQTYAVLAKTYPVLEATVNTLKLPIPAEKLRDLFTTAVIPQTALLTLTVTYTDAALCAAIADELARQLIRNSPTNLTEDQQRQVSLLQDEISSASEQLRKSRANLAEVESKLNVDLPEADQTRLNRERADLIAQINTVQSNLAQLTNTLALIQQEGTANVLTVVERARPPQAPVETGGLGSLIFAGMIGGTLAAGAAYLLETLNDTIRLPSEVTGLAGGIPLLGAIPSFGRRGTYRDKLIALEQPHSAAAESYRALRVNLIFTEGEAANRPAVYVISSPNPEEGKSVTAANLAVSFANAGLRVLLIDADLRRPTQHAIFGIANEVGLSSALSRRFLARVAESAKATADPEDTLDLTAVDLSSVLDAAYIRALVESLASPTAIAGLDVITAGRIRATSSELLSSPPAQAMVRAIVGSERHHVVILDAPPALTISDAGVLANVTEGRILLVVEAGRTRRGALTKTAGNLRSIGVRLAGVVVNRLHKRDAETDYSYAGYAPYGMNAPTESR
ncbi:MAG TPA: hypothetical protein PLD47_15215 [Aggregatilineales bacterium]|nr:hypothetical protein [Anaerolineales bacterium]HRE49076.1 hypothetical protein [Aggregatilineales bacterium]